MLSNICSNDGCVFVFAYSVDIVATPKHGIGVLHPRLATAWVARCPSKGAAIQESIGQQWRTNIGDIRRIDWLATISGHECSGIPPNSGPCWRESSSSRDCEVECIGQGWETWGWWSRKRPGTSRTGKGKGKEKAAPGEIELIIYSLWFDCVGISRGGRLLLHKCKVPINVWFSYPLPVHSACTISFTSIMCTAFLGVIECCWCWVWALSLLAQPQVVVQLCGVVFVQCALPRRTVIIKDGMVAAFVDQAQACRCRGWSIGSPFTEYGKRFWIHCICGREGSLLL